MDQNGCLLDTRRDPCLFPIGSQDDLTMVQEDTDPPRSSVDPKSFILGRVNGWVGKSDSLYRSKPIFQ